MHKIQQLQTIKKNKYNLENTKIQKILKIHILQNKGENTGNTKITEN